MSMICCIEFLGVLLTAEGPQMRYMSCWSCVEKRMLTANDDAVILMTYSRLASCLTSSTAGWRKKFKLDTNFIDLEEKRRYVTETPVVSSWIHQHVRTRSETSGKMIVTMPMASLDRLAAVKDDCTFLSSKFCDWLNNRIDSSPPPVVLLDQPVCGNARKCLLVLRKGWSSIYQV